MNITNELREKLLTADSAEKVAELLKADGQEVEPDDVEKLWTEVTKKRQKDDRELSVDELEAVSGGADRNWVTDGCAATVEYGSWCYSNDRCISRDVTYDFQPTPTLCPNCGKNMYLQNTIHLSGLEYENQYRCKFCGCVKSDPFSRVSVPV